MNANEATEPAGAAPTGETFNEFEWIQLRQDIGLEELKHQESAQEKFKRKFAENPFVPIGCLLTAAALTYGLYSFKSGRRQMSQTMMRARIGAQGFTVLSILVGIGYNASKS